MQLESRNTRLSFDKLLLDSAKLIAVVNGFNCRLALFLETLCLYATFLHKLSAILAPNFFFSFSIKKKADYISTHLSPCAVVLDK